MSAIPQIAIRGIRQTIPTGYVIGRVSSGTGQPELVPLTHLGTNLQSAGAVYGPAAPQPVEWNAGTVEALGTNISINSDTLEVAQNWNAGTVTAVGTGITVTAGHTLLPNYQGGTLTTFNTGLTLSSGTLTPNWQQAIVTTLGPSMSITSGTLNASLVQNWNAGTVASTGDGIGITSGTIQSDHQGTLTLSGTTTGTISPVDGVTSELVNVGTAAGTISVASGLYNGQHLRLEILQGTTPHTVGFDTTVYFGTDVTSYTASAVAGARDLIQLVWNGATGKWMFAAVNHGF